MGADLRYAPGSLAKSPRFMAFARAAAELGRRPVPRRPLPMEGPGRIVRLHEDFGEGRPQAYSAALRSD